VVVVEAPLLLEAGWAAMVDEVWVATAPREVIFRRLSRQRGLSHDAVLARIRTQLPVNRQVQQASRVINTDTSLERLRPRYAGSGQRLFLNNPHFTLVSQTKPAPDYSSYY